MKYWECINKIHIILKKVVKIANTAMQDLVSAVPKKILTTLQMKMKVPENNPGISF